MTTPALTWTGLDLTALPYESYVSLLFRFCWRNVLDWHMLYGAFGIGPSQSRTLDVQALSKATFGPILHERFEQALAEQDDCWQYKQLRFCPVCLEACYHSYLFQCHMLTRCPIHAVPLRTRCMCCEAQTPHGKSHRYLYLHSYTCTQCHRPLAGAEADLTEHLELRTIQDSLALALAPYDRWWTETSPIRHKVEKMVRAPGSPMQQRWCQVDAFKRSVCGNGGYRLDHLSAGEYPSASITRLSWCLRACDKGDYPYVFNCGKYGRSTTSAPTKVYRCVLRRLTRWVGHAVGLSASEVEREVEAIRFGWDRGVKPELLALWLMRLEMEVPLITLLTEQPPFCDPPQLSKDCTTLADINYENIPRLAWRGIFFALFSAWLNISRNEQYPHLADYLRGIRDPRNLIFFRQDVKEQYWWDLPPTMRDGRDETWYEGEVAFLTVPGLFEPNVNGNDKVLFGPAMRRSRTSLGSPSLPG